MRTFARADDDREATAEVARSLHAAVELARKEIVTRARLVVEVAPCPRVRTSEARLLQICLNLFSNAWQALPESRSSQHEIAVRARREGEDAVIEVSDTGPGVPEPDRERIFEPFVTTKGVGGGSGLGLFVCRNIARAAGGEIHAYERAGGGALFRVRLPGVPEPPAATAPAGAPPAAAPPAGRAHRVLIVDDDPHVGGALQGALVSEGFSATVVNDARRALELMLQDLPLDLVYCDVMMPGMTGVELYDEVARQRPALLGKLVLMTGGAFTSEARAFVERHPEIAVQKPFPIAADARRRLQRIS